MTTNKGGRPREYVQGPDGKDVVIDGYGLHLHKKTRRHYTIREDGDREYFSKDKTEAIFELSQWVHIAAPSIPVLACFSDVGGQRDDRVGLVVGEDRSNADLAKVTMLRDKHDERSDLIRAHIHPSIDHPRLTVDVCWSVRINDGVRVSHIDTRLATGTRLESPQQGGRAS